MSKDVQFVLSWLLSPHFYIKDFGGGGGNKGGWLPGKVRLDKYLECMVSQTERESEELLQIDKEWSSESREQILLVHRGDGRRETY